MSDLELRQDILDELEFEPRVDAANIGVAVAKGVVTLTGHVSSYAQKIAAEAAARRVKGVRAIAQEIEVRFPFERKDADAGKRHRAAKHLYPDALGFDLCIPLQRRFDPLLKVGHLDLRIDLDLVIQADHPGQFADVVLRRRDRQARGRYSPMGQHGAG
jgi:hypothetical protein